MLSSVAVGHPPNASFSYSPEHPKPGDSVTFTSTSTKQPGDEAYFRNDRWDLDDDGEFDDGLTYEGGPSSVTHTFPAAGDHVVRMETGLTEPDGGFASHSSAIATRTVHLANPVPQPEKPSDPNADAEPDGILNGGDNCPFAVNPSQDDRDLDGMGDMCDDDADGDGVPTGNDNCTSTPNPGQQDLDADGLGDGCDDDSDGDGVEDVADNCVIAANPSQGNVDRDQFGDACDDDIDGDTLANGVDNCPTRAGDDGHGCPRNKPPVARFNCSGYNPIEHTQSQHASNRVHSAAATNLTCDRLVGVATKSTEIKASDSKDPDGKIVKYQWKFNAPANVPVAALKYDKVSTTTIVSHVYPAKATYLLVLRVTDDRGATDIDTIKVDVRETCEPDLKFGRALIRTSPCFVKTSSGSGNSKRFTYTSKKAVSFNGIVVVPKDGKTVEAVSDERLDVAGGGGTGKVPHTTSEHLTSFTSDSAKVLVPFGPDGLEVYNGALHWTLDGNRIRGFEIKGDLKLNGLSVSSAPPLSGSTDLAPVMYDEGVAKLAFYPRLPADLFAGAPTPDKPASALVIDTGTHDVSASRAGTGAQHFSVKHAGFGPLQLKNLDVRFDGKDFWQIEAEIALPEPIPYEIAGGVGLRDGKFEYGHGEADNLHIAISPIVGLNRIAFSVAINPQAVQPSFQKCQPFIGKKDWTSIQYLQYLSGQPASDFWFLGPHANDHFTIDYGKPTFVFCGEIDLIAPAALEIMKLTGGGGYVSYSDLPSVVRFYGDLYFLDIRLLKARGAFWEDGYIHMGTSLHFGLAGAAHLDGGLGFDGYFGGKTKVYPSPPYFNAELWADACIDLVDLCAGLDGIMSSKGIAGCLSIDLVLGTWSPGFGYVWGGDFTAYFSGCDVGDYREHFATRSKRKAAGPGRRPKLDPGQETTFDLPPGLPGEVVSVTGESAPPVVTLVGPGGERMTTPKVLGGMMQKPFMVIKDLKGNRTSIAVGAPSAGTWKMTVEDGSSAVTSVKVADGLDPPKFTAAVSGRGRTRTLTYSVTPRDGQVVRFYEEGPSTGRLIGSTSKAGGKLTWMPAEGASETRTIFAIVEQDGMGRGRFDVATYKAVSRPLARATHIEVKRRGAALRATWRKVPGAARYTVMAKLSDGRRLVLNTHRPVVRTLATRRVRNAAFTIRAVTPGGREGRRAHARFPLEAKRTKRRR
jgi:hypothetical protein